MSFSQNGRFLMDVARGPDEEKWPGEELARRIQSDIGSRDWSVSEVDVWRDVGWCFECRRLSVSLEVVVAQLEPNEWMVQVGPSYAPGIVGRLLGKSISGSRQVLLEIARVIHESISGTAANVMWGWDGMPEPGRSTREPEPFTGSAG